MQRRVWKLDLIAAVETRASGTPRALGETIADFEDGKAVRYTKIITTGTYDHNTEFHVFGTNEAQPGYFIFTRFAPTNGESPFFINRGFVPEDRKPATSRVDGQPDGQVSVTGLFRYAEKKPFLARLVAPPDDPGTNRWYSRDPAKFATKLPLETAVDWYIDSLGTETQSLFPRGGTTRLAFNNRHLEYALTWYGLALTLLSVFLVYSRRKR